MSLLNSYFQSDQRNNVLNWENCGRPFEFTEQNFLGNILIKKQDNRVKIKQIYVKDQYLGTKNSKDKIKWISIENSILKETEESLNGEKEIQLKYRDNVISFYGLFNELKSHLVKFTIQENFQKYYQLERKIGEGTFAQVFLAEKEQTKEEFAIKIFDKYQMCSQTDQQAFQKEISILRVLNIDSILKIYEVYESQGYIYIVLEYIRGQTLNQLLKSEGKMNEEEIKPLIQQLLRTLNYIHIKGIMHRDLKPDNIMLRNNNNNNNNNNQINTQACVVMDFGLSDYYNPEGKYLFKRCGTPGYMAPEILHDLNYNYKCDIFSIGVIMYMMLTRENPFEGTSQERVENNYRGEIKNLNQLPLSWKGQQFLKSLLNINPLKRPHAKLALQHIWFQEEKIIINNKTPHQKTQTLHYIKSSNDLFLSIPQKNRLPSMSPRSPQLSNYFASPRIRRQQRISHFQLNEESPQKLFSPLKTKSPQKTQLLSVQIRIKQTRNNFVRTVKPLISFNKLR